ncbi:MAG: hypothetical protein HYX78_02345 [Armatimonadetes bacterium]|nr:hypothetical protein [Armatimonadota bacterium]
MGFELFTQYGRGNRPTCSIRTNGQIGFNRGAIRAFGLRSGFAKLYFDKERKLIGIQHLGEVRVENSTKVIVKDNNAFVSARSFLDYYGIEYRSGSSTYEARNDSDMGLIIIDLNEPIRTGKAETDYDPFAE